jgi:glycosyltransferase involved in cell wall biosynthesis
MRFNNHEPEVIFVGQAPPPVTGLAFATLRLGEALAKTSRVNFVRVNPVETSSRPFYHLSRLFRVAKSLYILIRAAITSRRERKICVLGCDGGFGIVYLTAQLAVARIFAYKLYLHHHSYSYIDRRSRLMDLTLAVSGPNTIHIFLAREMAQSFVDRYSRAVNTIVLSNAAHVPSNEPRALLVRRRPFTVGILSNLNASKGLYKFIEVFESAVANKLDIQGVLAGPVTDRADEEFLLSAIRRARGRLEWRGSVHNNSKDAFFDSIDLFLFPTCYKNEAQPIVLFEAMAHGIPVVAYDRGAIAGQVMDAGLIVPRNQNFSNSALEFISFAMSNPAQYSDLCRLARQRFEEQKASAQGILRNILLLAPEYIEPAGLFKE